MEAGGFKLLYIGDGRDFKNNDESEEVYRRNDIDVYLVNVMIHPFNIRDIKHKVIVPLHLYKFMQNREYLKESNFNKVIEMYDQHEKELGGIEKRLLFCGESFEFPL